MLSLPFLMMLIRQPFSAFAAPNTASEQENQCKNMRFKFRFLLTHHCTIPFFHHAPPPADERNELTFIMDMLT